MKKSVFLLATMVLFLMSLPPAFADDAVELQKLQPLSPSEQSMYEGIKNNASELHKFIVTRMYIRSVKQVIGIDSASSTFQESNIDKFPAVPEDLDVNYCDSPAQGAQLLGVRLFQEGKKVSS